jgi:sulfite exporter TauE/SafE
MSLDVLLSAALLAGFVGSGHCFAMCGAVVTLLEGPRPGAMSVTRRLSYNAGRLGFYLLIGGVAGTTGMALTQLAGATAGLFALRICAALLVILLAVSLLFDLRTLGFVERAGTLVWQRLSPLARHVLPIASPLRALGAGFIWGALPCGLVYSAAALAATSGGTGAGALVMLAFWCGTLPALYLAGAMAGRLLAVTRQPSWRRASGLLLLLVGFIALAMPLRHAAGGHGGHAAASIAADGPDAAAR